MFLPLARRGLLPILTFAVLTSIARASVGATCYLPNGTAAYDNTGVMPYTPCKPKEKHSMCCRSNSTDTCRSDGLCDSSWDGNIWRDFCTDPTWQAPNCIKLCLGSHGTDGDGNTGGSVRVTECDNGSYCCGAGDSGKSCCRTGAGVWIARDGNTTNARPGASTSASSASVSSTAASSTTVNSRKITATTSATPTTATSIAHPASQTASAPGAVVTKTTTKTSNNTGAIAGGVVAGLVAATFIIGATIWAVRRRRDRPIEEKHGWTPPVKTPALYGEMEGSNARQELAADTGAHEMGTGGPLPKQHRTAELP